MTTTIPDLKITNLAVAILVDKFISLSKEEKDDVCTLMNELANTQSPPSDVKLGFPSNFRNRFVPVFVAAMTANSSGMSSRGRSLSLSRRDCSD